MLADIRTTDRHLCERLRLETNATATPKITNWKEAVSK
jgi:hypothetical protein